MLTGILGAVAYVVLPRLQVRGEPNAPPTPDSRSHHQSALADIQDAGSAVRPELATEPALTGYVRYANERYHYAVDIPDDFVKFQDSKTGDGREYSNGNGDAVLQVYGTELVGSLDDLYKAEWQVDEVDGKSRWILPMHTVTQDMYTITGFDSELPFVTRLIVTGGISARLYVRYTNKDKLHFEAVLPHTRDSFSFTAASNTTPLPRDAGTLPDAGAPDASAALAGGKR